MAILYTHTLLLPFQNQRQKLNSIVWPITADLVKTEVEKLSQQGGNLLVEL